MWAPWIRRRAPSIPRPIIKVSPEPHRRIYIWQYVRGVLFVQFVLFATWNRSGYSYINWVTAAPRFTPLMAVAGIGLLIAHVTILRIAYVALGYPGIVAAAMLLASILLALWQLDWINLGALTRQVEFWMFVTASILSIGIAWAKYQQRLSGQRDVVKSPP